MTSGVRPGSPYAGLVGGDAALSGGVRLARRRRARPAPRAGLRLFPAVGSPGWPCFSRAAEAFVGVGPLEVLADQLALLGQELVEVLVDVLFADRFRGQVEVLDLLKLARTAPPPSPATCPSASHSRPVRPDARPRTDDGARRRMRGSDGGRLDDTSGSNGPRVLARRARCPPRTSRTSRRCRAPCRSPDSRRLPRREERTARWCPGGHTRPRRRPPARGARRPGSVR